MIRSPQPATLAHVAVLAAIHASAFPPCEAWGEDAFALQLALPGVFGLLDSRGGMILARATVDEAEVLTLAVNPATRHQGVGSGLLAAAMQQAHTRGATAMLLEVSVANDSALRLYAKAGFLPAGRRARYYADGTDALVLRAAL